MANTKTATKQITNAIKSQSPEVYFEAGVGWCGPNWQEAERTDQTMKATTTAIEAFRQRTRHGWRARRIVDFFQ